MRLSAATRLALACIPLAVGCQKESTPSVAHASEPVHVAPASAESSLEAEVKRLADRELPLPAEAPVSGAYFSASASGSHVRVEASDNGTLIAMDIGTRKDVSCMVYSEPNDAGGTLRAMVQSTRKPGRSVNVLPGALTVEAEHPVQRLDVLYKDDRPGEGIGVGVLKLAWIGDFAHPILCHHDELGYVQAFEAVVARLAGTLVTPSAPKAERVEISRTTFRGVPVGFDFVGEWRESDAAPAARRRTSHSLMSLPVPGDYSARDTVSTVYYDDLARIQAGHWAVATDGVLSQNLTVEKPGRSFRVAGSAFGKPVAARFPGASAGLPDARLDPALGRRIAQGGAFSSARTVYAPLDVPGELLEERVEHGDVPGKAELVRGDERVRITVDADGRVARRELGEGEATLVTELAFARAGQDIRTSDVRTD